MWSFFLSGLDLKYTVFLDALTISTGYLAILSIVVHIEKSKHTIKIRSAIISVVLIGVLSAILSYFVSYGRLQVQQNEMDSKYQLANAYFDSGNYLDAIETYEELSPDYSEYAEAMQRRHQAITCYVESCLAQAEEYTKNGNDTLALDMLVALKEDTLFAEDPIIIATVQSKIGTIIQEYAEKSVQTANDYWETGDIDSALETLQTAATICVGNLLLDNTTKKIKDEYRNMIVDEARQAYESSGYQSAISILSEGLAILNQDPELLTLIEEYRQKAPVRLSSLEYYMSNGYGTFNHGDEKEDIFGNSHSDIIYIICGFSSSTSYASETYRIDKNYTRLVGTVFLSYENRDTQYSGAVRIYGDGDLLFSVTDITAGFEPLSFDIDVTYVTDLTVSISDPGFYGAEASRCLSDVLLYPA